MSNTYTGNPANNPASLTMPLDGDTKPVASVRAALEGIADGLAHAQWPSTDNTKAYPLASQSIFRAQPYTPLIMTVNINALITPKWGIEYGSGQATQVDVTAGAGNDVDFPLHLPNGCTLASVFVNIVGSNVPGSHAGLPGNMPQIRVFKQDVTGNTGVAISSLVTDGSASVGAYETPHQLQAVCNVAIDTTQFKYYVRVIGETGANAQAGLQVCGVSVQFTVTAMDKGAS